MSDERKDDRIMFKIVVRKTYEEISAEAFKPIKKIMSGKKPVLGLATGSSPVGLYNEMIRDHRENGTSYRNVVTFNLDEYVGLSRDHKGSYYAFMYDNLFNYIDIDENNINIPDGNAVKQEAACREYEKKMSRYDIDIQVLGIGSNGHIAFNEPGCPFDIRTHTIELTEQTRADNARFFDGDISQVPTMAITQGLADIMEAKKIIMIATGENKADAIREMIEGPKCIECPASVLQGHEDVTVYLDEAAASKLNL